LLSKFFPAPLIPLTSRSLGVIAGEKRDEGNFWEDSARGSRREAVFQAAVSLIRQADRARGIDKPMRIGSVGKIGKTGERPDESSYAMTGLHCAPRFVRREQTSERRKASGIALLQ
jgi:hypothetical protein